MAHTETLAILGGPKVRKHPFATRVTMGEPERKAAISVLQSDVLSAFIGSPGKFFAGGPNVRQFENEWAKSQNVRHAISVNSWTTGLMTAVGAIGVEPGDEVICSPYTMSASATCALFYGGIPIFADIDPQTWCLSPRSIEEKITERTKAVIVVHLFGQAADMDSILEVTKPRGIKVIEDAAQAPGVRYRERYVGAIGDVGGFSLNFHKHIHTGEGGMLVTNDEDIATRCRMIRNHGENANAGMTGAELANTIGSNYRLTELQAAIGIEQLKRLPKYLKARNHLAQHLTRRIADIHGLSVTTVEPNCSHAYYVYPIRYDAKRVGLSRNMFLRAVLAELPEPDGFEGTPLTEGYVKPLYLNAVYQQQIAIGTKGFPFTYNPGVTYSYEKGLCPVTERAFEEEMLLSPIVREPLTTDDMDDLAAAIEKVCANSGRLRDHFGDAAIRSNEVFTPVDAAVSTNVR